MKRLCLLAAAVFALGVGTLTGCDKSTETATGRPTPSGPAASATPIATPSATPSGPADATPSPSTGNESSPLPDICTLLSKAEVQSLTGRQITLMTNEGGNSANTRYCQWQLSTGQLTVAVTVMTRGQFDTQNPQARQVGGVGEAAYTLSGHLFVFAAGRQVDVYASSASGEAANLTVERRTADLMLPRLGG